MFTILMVVAMLFLSGCISGQAPSGKRTRIKDFSIVKDFSGCGSSFLILESKTCITKCAEGTHIATPEELDKVKKALLADKDEAFLSIINNSKGICTSDIVLELRPNLQIEIKSDFCSCVDGVSDLISDCDAICSTKLKSSTPTLFVNTQMGPEIALNEKLKNLHNWCTVQLIDDETTPQCALSVSDGSTTLNLPVSTFPNSNSFSSEIKNLAYDRTYIAKIVEFKTGSNAQSKEFQFRRKKPAPSDEAVGALKVTPITQYTCISYSGSLSSTGVVRRLADTFSRFYFYFPSNETPVPRPPVAPGHEDLIVCHNEQQNPGNDSIDYPRLEEYPSAFSLWDKADSRFAVRPELGGKTGITKIIEDRLANEFPTSGIVGASLFSALRNANAPPVSASSTSNNNLVQGFIMVPFTDFVTKKSYCPSAAQLLSGNNPLWYILSDYMVDTEGLFISEKEGEVTFINGIVTIVYARMYVTETVVIKYGFYVENGLRIKATTSSMNTKTIHFYWPVSTTADPLTAGGRKLFTVKTFPTLSGQTPSTAPTSLDTTDKRLGCIPKTVN